MAKIKFGNVVADARNAAGGIVYSRNTYGAYLRQKVSPVQPRSPAQQAQRSSMTDLSKRYRDVLTASQRLGWAAFAAANPRTDVFGAPIVLAPIAMYQACNRILDQMLAARIDTAPADLSVQSPLTVSLVADASSNNIIVTFTPTPLDTDIHAAIFLTPQFSQAALFYTNKLRLVTVSGGAVASPITITTAYTDRFGPIVAGTQIGCELKLYNAVNGAASAGIRATTITVA